MIRTLPKHIELYPKDCIVIDGYEFPWLISEDVRVGLDQNIVSYVDIRIFTEKLTIHEPGTATGKIGILLPSGNRHRTW